MVFYLHLLPEATVNVTISELTGWGNVHSIWLGSVYIWNAFTFSEMKFLVIGGQWLYGYICVNNRKQMESDNVALWRSALPANLQLWSQHKHKCTKLLSSDLKPTEILPVSFAIKRHGRTGICDLGSSYRKSKAIPVTGLDRPLGFQEFEALRFQDNRQMKVVGLSTLCTGRLYP
jgi:hypothetical protein